MARRATLLTLFLAALLSIALFRLKYEVQSLEDELTALNQTITKDQESIHVLKAEWSHLNNPARLRDQATRLLELRPVTPDQLGRLEEIPMRPIVEDENQNAEQASPEEVKP